MMEKITELIEKLRESSFDTNRNLDIYLNFYNLESDHIEHCYEFVECSGERIFVQTFSPLNPVAVTYVIHGYFDHAGSMSNLINYLTRRKHKVITYDLQGHGLSSGKRLRITDFSEYVDVFKEIYERKKESNSLPAYVISHSTGGAITIEYLFQYCSPFQKVILVSPLVRSYAWNLSKLGFTFMSSVTNELNRMFKNNSSNEEYLQFVKKDPLQHNKVPLDWFKSLIAWNERIKEYLPLDEKLFVIQGDKDRTVDWKHNLSFIKGKFPECKIQIVSGGDHQLFNENEELLLKMFEYMDEILKEKK
ncbi:alpha/beta hydrolase [Metabacillus fastidiosus]|uniref:alpha/beta hydrolase n=1 Tax=Metabacillus fastidiosus TaxID=1458 RepID=UPI002E206F71|nr:alpha/beta hydrolase [Metabacillus fastidiosus]